MKGHASWRYLNNAYTIFGINSTDFHAASQYPVMLIKDLDINGNGSLIDICLSMTPSNLVLTFL